MRVVLQNNSSSLYFCRGDQWTPGFKGAFDFRALETAVEFSRRQNLIDVQAVIIEDRTGRVALPRGVNGDVQMVRVELPEPLSNDGLKIGMDPSASPLTFRMIVPLYPPVGVTVTV